MPTAWWNYNVDEKVEVLQLWKKSRRLWTRWQKMTTGNVSMNGRSVSHLKDSNLKEIRKVLLSDLKCQLFFKQFQEPLVHTGEQHITHKRWEVKPLQVSKNNIFKYIFKFVICNLFKDKEKHWTCICRGENASWSMWKWTQTFTFYIHRSYFHYFSHKGKRLRRL